MTYEEAKRDIYDYLKSKDEEYFTARGVTKALALASADLIDKLTAEHYKCVHSFGNKPKWSCEDACDNDPGISFADCIIECFTVDAACKVIKELYSINDVCIGELLASVKISGLSVEDTVTVYAKLYQEYEGDEICRIDEDGLRYTIGT
ncbi:MAG: hypothetical protein E7544_09155 [Ruminococcaceae bacterium]|nr:hypothetical protein [Oscillospiraceae bacterium]